MYAKRSSISDDTDLALRFIETDESCSKTTDKRHGFREQNGGPRLPGNGCSYRKVKIDEKVKKKRREKVKNCAQLFDDGDFMYDDYAEFVNECSLGSSSYVTSDENVYFDMCSAKPKSAENLNELPPTYSDLYGYEACSYQNSSIGNDDNVRIYENCHVSLDNPYENHTFKINFNNFHEISFDDSDIYDNCYHDSKTSNRYFYSNDSMRGGRDSVNEFYESYSVVSDHFNQIFPHIKPWLIDVGSRCEEYDGTEIFEQKSLLNADNVNYITNLFTPSPSSDAEEKFFDENKTNFDALDNILRDLGEAISWLEPRQTSCKFSTSLLNIFDEFLNESEVRSIMADENRSSLNCLQFENNVNELSIPKISKIPSFSNLSALSDDVFLTPENKVSRNSLQSIGSNYRHNDSFVRNIVQCFETRPLSDFNFDNVNCRSKLHRSSLNSFDINLIFDNGRGNPVPPKRRKNKSTIEKQNPFSERPNSIESDYQNIWNCTTDAELPIVNSENVENPTKRQTLKQCFGEERIQSAYFESMSDIPTLIITSPRPYKLGSDPNLAKKPTTFANRKSLNLDNYVTNNNLNKQLNYEHRKLLECNNDSDKQPEELHTCGSKCEVKIDTVNTPKNKYSDEDFNNFVNNFKNNNCDYFNNKDKIFENVFAWKKMLLQPDYFEDEEHEWVSTVPDDLEHCVTGERVVPDIRSIPHAITGDDEKQPLETKRIQKSPDVKRYSQLTDTHGSTGSVNDVDIRDKHYQVASRKESAKSLMITRSPSKASTIRRQNHPLERDFAAIFNEARVILPKEVQRTKLVENGKKVRKNWQNNLMVLTQTHLVFCKDQYSYNAMKDKKIPPELVIPLDGLEIRKAEGKSSKVGVYSLLYGDSETLISAEHPVTKIGDTCITSDELAVNIEAAIHDIMSRLDHSPRIEIGNVTLRDKEKSESMKEQFRMSQSVEDLKRSPNKEQKKQKQTLLQRFMGKRPPKEELERKGYLKGTVFGGSLERLCPPERAPRVPEFVTRCTQALEKESFLSADGLYRASANLSQIQKLRHQVEQGDLAAVDKESDPHVLAGTLKLFFRELKHPLIPVEHFDDFVNTSGNKSPPAKIKLLRSLIQKFPPWNRDTLRHILQHLTRVTSQQSTNRMHNGNLSIVWGPSLLWAEPKPNKGVAEGVHHMAVHCVQQNNTVEDLLDHFQEIFKGL